ncbi:MAG: GPR endopeptidase [Firmicutes bacterium]|nr:GPR endopeptidase [Bacillota bacterium]
MKIEANDDYSRFSSAHFVGRLDLAHEAKSILQGKQNRELPGVIEEITSFAHGKVTSIEIFSELGARIMSKPKGKYITIDAPEIRSGRRYEAEISAITAKQIKALLPQKESTVLLIGLGNNRATPDALGPKVVQYTVATRHILQQDDALCNLAPLCTLAPGVLGITGIETAEIIKGVVQRIKPDVIIAVDALAAASVKRVSTTIQITDTGIQPGSGVGNKRLPITKETLGIPVIAIGVPTVVSSSVIIYETLLTLGKELKTESAAWEHIDDETFLHIEEELLETFEGNLIVTPKEIDRLIENIARIIAAAIAQAVHSGVNQHNYQLYIE